MKAITPILFLSVCQFCFAGGETNIIAMSDWSKPVRTIHGQTLRARMIVAQGHSPAHSGPWPETEFYLEFQNVTGAAGTPLQFYFDPGGGFRGELLDATGKPPPPVGMSGSGGGAVPCWITLPYDSTIRLRTNMYGYGLKPEDGFILVLSPPTMQNWTIKLGDPNDYFMSGTFTVTAPTDHTARRFDDERTIWSGTLELPKMKIAVPKR